MVTTTLGTALPVTSTEGDNPSVATHTTRVTHTVTTVAHVRRHHRWRAVAVVVVVHWVGSGRHSGERATEACSTTLEVGEATGRASPVTRTGTVLGGREGSEDLGGAVQNPAG